MSDMKGAATVAQREVYPNAPLRLVTAEFAFPISPRLSGADLLTVLGSEFGETFPIMELANLKLAIGAPTPRPASLIGEGGGYRLLTLDRTTAVTVSANRITVETTTYRHWEDFRRGPVASAVMTVGDRLGAIAGLDRVGLRFINEVRVPGMVNTNPLQWRGYIAPELLAAADLVGGREVKTVQIALHLAGEDGTEVMMRAGALEGRVVDDTGPLRLPRPPQPGAFFLVDIDSFWDRAAIYDNWDSSRALDIIDRLHTPIDELFESCLTDKLRREVLRREM